MLKHIHTGKLVLNNDEWKFCKQRPLNAIRHSNSFDSVCLRNSVSSICKGAGKKKKKNCSSCHGY